MSLAKPAVAAIIPTRNRAVLTERAVASVLAQTRPPDELVVIDDGSTDGTAEHLRSTFGDLDVRSMPSSGKGAASPRTGANAAPAAGVSAARNHGIRETRSEWLAFLDSDDEWLQDKLEAQLAALAADPVHPEGSKRNVPPEGGQGNNFLLCHCDEIWIRNGQRVNPGRRHRKRGGHIFQHCLPLCAISPSAAIIHRSLFETVGLFDESLPACEDYDLWLRICCRHPVLYVDHPLVRKHGGHSDQLSRTPALDRYRIRALEKVLASGELSEADQQAAAVTLEQKITVYTGGAAKRGRWQEVRDLEQLRQRYLGIARAAAVGAGG